MLCARLSAIVLVLWPKRRIEHLRRRPWTRRGKNCRQEMGFAYGPQAGVCIPLNQDRRELGLETRIIPQQPGELATLLQNGIVPAMAVFASLWLVASLQGMHHEHLEAVLQFALLAFPQALYLLSESLRVKVVPFAFPDQCSRAQTPGVEVCFV
jgi:hypothetical protein